MDKDYKEMDELMNLREFMEDLKKRADIFYLTIVVPMYFIGKVLEAFLE